MPVKPTRRNGKNKKITAPKRIKKDIAKAVDNIPELIAQHIKLEEAAAPQNITPPFASFDNPKTTPAHQAPKNSGLLLWLGVGLITLVIFILWMINTQALVYDLVRGETKEGELWNTATTDLASVFSQATDDNGVAITAELDKLKDGLMEKSPTSTEETAKTETEIKQILAAWLIATTTESATNTEIIEE